MTARILFCLKYRESNWGHVGSDLSSGLRNSVSFIVQMLNDNDIEAKMVHLVDNNKIDRAIHEFRPDICIIEAFWVVPSKVAQLQKLWPNVHFAVRNHSEFAFLASEGIAMEWTIQYLRQGVEIMSNSPRAVDDMKRIADSINVDPDLCTYAPNWYPLPSLKTHKFPQPYDPVVKVGCFGAIRPLKNHLTQAIAAIKFARWLDRDLEFHINSSRVEGYGAPILKNLRALFAETDRAKLIEHPWMPRTEDEDGPTQHCFLAVMREMDYSLQVSFSETFNIVTADAILCHVPVVTSEQVPWIRRRYHADPNDSESICQHLISSHIQPRTWLIGQWEDLAFYCDETLRHWINRFG